MPVDLRSVIDLTLKMAAHEIRHRARVVLDIDSVSFVLADEARLGQVLLNLVINAAQAIPEGRTEQNEIRVSARLRDDGRVSVEIADTGVGIPPEKLPHIFDPFYTTKPVGVGTGLGLAIVHGILKTCDGEISVESDVGRGTTVTVTLPRGATPKTPLPGPLSVGRRGAGRVLVVDDEPGIGDVISRLFRERYEIVCDHSAADALARLQHEDRFDVVLCDLMMPEVTGMELYSRAVAERPELAHRFDFMTGGAFTESARAFLERTPNECIDKPFDVQALKQLLLERVGTAPEARP